MVDVKPEAQKETVLVNRKKKDVALATPAAKVEKKVEKKVEPAKAPKEPKAPKKEAVAKPKKEALKVNVPAGVKLKQTKFVVVASTEDGKKMWMRGATIGLTGKIDVKGFKKVSEEEAKKNHLGKTRMLGHVSTQEELDEVISKFFA